MNTFFAKILLVAFIACTLAACGAVPTVTEIPPTAEQTTPKPQHSRTPIPGPTRRPSQTLLAPDPSQTPSATDQIDATSTTTQLTFGDCINPAVNQSNYSPKGTWAVCGYEGGNFNVVNRDGTSWHFSTQEQFGVDYHGTMYILHWTADEKFFYFSIMRDIGDGGLLLGLDAEVLLRMDVPNRKASIIIGDLTPAHTDQPDVKRHLYVVSISPGTRQIAYALYNSASSELVTQLHFMDLQGGNEKVIDMEPEYNAIGQFTWSANGQQFTYKLYAESETDFCIYTYSMRFLDLRDFSSNTFVKKTPLSHCETTDGDEFEAVTVLADQVILKKNYETWIYDVKSQRLTLQSTATP